MRNRSIASRKQSESCPDVVDGPVFGAVSPVTDSRPWPPIRGVDEHQADLADLALRRTGGMGLPGACTGGRLRCKHLVVLGSLQGIHGVKFPTTLPVSDTYAIDTDCSTNWGLFDG